MPARKQPERPSIEPRAFASTDEIDRGIAKLERRIQDLASLDVRAAIVGTSGQKESVQSGISETILDVFGQNSPEFREHEHLQIWAGSLRINMEDSEIIEATEQGKIRVAGILKGLVERLKEKREDFGSRVAPGPKAYFSKLNLHPRIAEVATDLFADGHHWEAVFAASKALINYVKERSRRDDLDGAPLMRTVFSKNNPVLKVNGLKDQVDADEQEGTMHLLEGAVLAIRNPGGHSFPEGSAQRAMEYISLLSLLAYRVQESNR